MVALLQSYRRSLALGVFCFLTSPLLAQDDPIPTQPTEEPNPESNAVEENNPVSQKVTLTIRAKGTGVPLKRVEVKNGDQRVYSDPEGKVEVEINDSLGNLTIYRSGFETMKVDFQTILNLETKDIFLFPAAPQDNEVTIRGVRKPEISQKSVSVEESAKVAPGGDPAQVTKLLPGVQVNNSRGDGRIVVRGSGPEDTNYFIDDIPVPFLFHQIGNISILPDQLLKEVEFSSGGFGPQYGNATGGVVTLRTKTEVPERSITELRANFPIYASVYHERPYDDKSWSSASYRRSYIQFLLPQFLESMEDERGASLTLTPYFGDAHAQYYRDTGDIDYRVLLLNSHDGLRAAIPADNFTDESGKISLDFYSAFTSLSLDLNWRLDKKWRLRLLPYVVQGQTKTQFADNRFRIDSRQVGLRTELTRRLGRGEKIYFGMDPQANAVDLDLLVPRFIRDDPFFDPEDAPKVEVEQTSHANDFGAWVGADKKVGEDLTLSPGLRIFTRSSMNRSPNLDPRLNTRWQLGDSAAKFAVGQFSKAPEFDEQDAQFGNINLNYERSQHYIAGWETRWSDRWKTDFQVFYKRTLDVVRNAPDPSVRLNNDGSVRTKGFEMFIRRNLTEKLFGWISYTWSENEERDNDQSPWRQAQYDQTHVLALVGSYRLTADWELGGRFNYNTGNTYTKVKDAVYNANLDKYQPRSGDDDLYASRLPDSKRLSLYGIKDFLFDTWKMQLRFGVEDYEFGKDVANVDYNYDYTEEVRPTTIPAIPFVEVRATL